MHEVLVNRLEGLSLPRKNVVSLTDRPDMTLDVYRGRKTTMQQNRGKQDSVKIALHGLFTNCKESERRVKFKGKRKRLFFFFFFCFGQLPAEKLFYSYLVSLLNLYTTTKLREIESRIIQ